VSAIIIDKGFTKWEILKVEFPVATILVCKFYVIKCFSKKVCNFEVPKDDRDTVRQKLATSASVCGMAEFEEK